MNNYGLIEQVDNSNIEDIPKHENENFYAVAQRDAEKYLCQVKRDIIAVKPNLIERIKSKDKNLYFFITNNSFEIELDFNLPFSGEQNRLHAIFTIEVKFDCNSFLANWLISNKIISLSKEYLVQFLQQSNGRLLHNYFAPILMNVDLNNLIQYGKNSLDFNNLNLTPWLTISQVVSLFCEVNRSEAEQLIITKQNAEMNLEIAKLEQEKKLVRRGRLTNASGSVKPNNSPNIAPDYYNSDQPQEYDYQSIWESANRWRQTGQKSLKWYIQSAKQGDATAQFNLATAYYREKKFTEAVEWYLKAAENSSGDAQFLLGLLYHSGNGVECNQTAAKSWLKKAALQGVSFAQNNLGVFHHQANEFELAVKWLKKAAVQADMYACSNLGLLYSNGDGVNQDFSAAIDWYQKAAELGDDNAEMKIKELKRFL